jgi:RimJ/RimL family protein N-acetyltransferase
VTSGLRPIPYTFPDLRLRAPQEGDVEARFALGRDPEITRLYGVDPQTLPAWTMERANAWVDRITNSDCAWVIEHQGRLIGGVGLHSHNADDHRAQLAIGIEEMASLGRGIGRRVIGYVLDHAFRSAGLHRVGVRVLAMNMRAIRCYAACGFRQEGVERQAAKIGDTWHDDVMMGILAEEYFATPRT